MLSKVFIDDLIVLTTLDFSDVVFSTQLHEQMHWLFLIAGNGDFRALIFVPLCRLNFWSDCNELSGAFKP